MSRATPPPRLPKAPPAPAKSAPVAAGLAPAFTVSDWKTSDRGEKVLVYGVSGRGKTTLASMMPRPVFIGIDDGAFKTLNPKTGDHVKGVKGVESFDDVRRALSQGIELFRGFKSIVIDTHTKLDRFAEAKVLRTISMDAKGNKPSSLEGYGYGKGAIYVAEHMRLILQDLDPLVRAGFNVCLLCQEHAAKISNAEGLEYLQAGPRLTHTNQASSRNDAIEWVDHVFRIAFLNQAISANDPKARVGKAHGDTTRVIHVDAGNPSYVAKNRGSVFPEPLVSFAAPDDDSVWKVLFREVP